MRRGRIFIIIAVILIIGLVAVALVARQFLAQPKPTEVPQTNTVGILIAGQAIPQGEKITEDALAVIEIPQDKVVTVMFTEDQKSELVGKVAKYPLEQGVVITRSMISEGELALSGPSWASRIPPGMTAVSIPISRLSSVAYGAADGAYVNLTACFLFVDVDPSFQSKTPNTVVTLRGPAGTPPDEMPGITLGAGTVDQPLVQGRTEVEPSFQQGIYVVPAEEQRPRLVCQMLLQDVSVLKLGNFSLVADKQGDEPAQPADAQQQAATPQAPDIITLVVSPQDSITLSYLVYSSAKLFVSLRNAGDRSRMATEAANLAFLLSQYNIPIPVKLPYVIEPRIDKLNEPVLKNDVPPPAE
ncbi:MAG: Flp pilus assembly protein CpaB [Chloroflexota bacterium]